jgi:hypothetical protein
MPAAQWAGSRSRKPSTLLCSTSAPSVWCGTIASPPMSVTVLPRTTTRVWGVQDPQAVPQLGLLSSGRSIHRVQKWMP